MFTICSPLKPSAVARVEVQFSLGTPGNVTKGFKYELSCVISTGPKPESVVYKPHDYPRQRHKHRPTRSAEQKLQSHSEDGHGSFVPSHSPESPSQLRPNPTRGLSLSDRSLKKTGTRQYVGPATSSPQFRGKLDRILSLFPPPFLVLYLSSLLSKPPIMTSLPPNVHISTHPCLVAKLSQLRSKSTSARDVKNLIHEISLLLGSEALAKAMTTSPGPQGETPLGFTYETTTASPGDISLIPILRSGLGMVEAIQTILPQPVPVHHLGLFRDPITLAPVEYYNNLPNHLASASNETPSDLAIILDPIIATGGTCAAAIQTLIEWGAKRVIVLSVLGAAEGVKKVAEEWPEGTEIWLAGVDQELTEKGMLRPGLGDVGDRLFLTIGK